ncbi:MAG: dihydrolipoamide acetyltransferase family protein [Gemmatimonadota bacterium]
MATKVVMAQLSPTMEEGKLVEWKVAEGERVSQGDIVAEIETDKANMDVEAMGGGVLRRILVQPGETAPVGALIGVIAEPDEEISSILEEAASAPRPSGPPRDAAPSGASGEAIAGGPGDEAAPRSTEVAPSDAGVGGPGVAPAERDGRVRASPVARKLARELGVDLSSVRGSGPAGRVVRADVEAAAREGGEMGEEAPAEAAVVAPAAGARPTREPAATPSGPRLEERVEEASQMRKAIARRLVQSIGPVPHFFLTTEVEMDRLLELRVELNERWPEGKIGVNDLLLKGTAEAIARHPEVNASWEDGCVRYHGSVDLGIAVAVHQGLITPVLRAAERKGLRQISREARELIQRARARKLAPEEYQGATFSVSNLGMYPIDEFTAVINPPEAGILAVGRTAEKPVVVEGEVLVRRRMRVTMSCDHRVIDGAMGAEFLGTFKAMLENPLEMLL